MTTLILNACLASTVFSTGCVDVNGGAVEVAWTIKSAQGELKDCEEAAVAAMRLCRTLEPGGSQVCDFEWPCDDHYGATAFEIPEGTYAFVIQPVCQFSGARPTGQVPPPLVRDIKNGDVASLDALLVVGDAQGLVCKNVSP